MTGQSIIENITERIKRITKGEGIIRNKMMQGRLIMQDTTEIGYSMKKQSIK